MSEKLFPFPESGQTRVRETGIGLFEVECRGVNKNDYHSLLGFFNSMGGRFGEFRFERAGVVHPKCRFDADSVSFTSHGFDTHSVTFPIKVLP